MLLSMMAAMVTMGMIIMVTIMTILVTKTFLFPAISQSISFLLLIDPGHEPFKLSTVQPDPPAHLTNIYGDTIAVLFFQSWFVASRTNHVDSFLIHNSPGTSG
jgi:hypothetical protein